MRERVERKRKSKEEKSNRQRVMREGEESEKVMA